MKHLNLDTFPHAILIDGLDECEGEDRQAELLVAIRECLLNRGLPFRIFIASRPEWAIRTALEPGGHLHAIAYHIRLSDEYDASGDMRRYLERRFQALSFRTGNPRWFTESDIETLVEAGSGQFVYVAMVYKYISERRTSPAENLKIVLTWTPHKGQMARPLEALDKLYTNVLLNAKDAYEATDAHSGRNFLLLLRIHHANCFNKLVLSMSREDLSKLLHLENGSTEILISDLHSVVTISGDYDSTSYLRMLHRPFSNFLDTESRAKDLFVPLTQVHAHLTKCCLLHIIKSPYPGFREFAIRYLPVFWRASSASIDDEIIVFIQKGGWHQIDYADVRYKGHYSMLLTKFDSITQGLKKRSPEAVVIMSGFFNKWKRDYEEFCLSQDEPKEAKVAHRAAFITADDALEHLKLHQKDIIKVMNSPEISMIALAGFNEGLVQQGTATLLQEIHIMLSKDIKPPQHVLDAVGKACSPFPSMVFMPSGTTFRPPVFNAEGKILTFEDLIPPSSASQPRFNVALEKGQTSVVHRLTKTEHTDQPPGDHTHDGQGRDERSRGSPTEARRVQPQSGIPRRGRSFDELQPDEEGSSGDNDRTDGISRDTATGEDKNAPIANAHGGEHLPPSQGPPVPGDGGTTQRPHNIHFDITAAIYQPSPGSGILQELQLTGKFNFQSSVEFREA
ncbi:hypothetical protein H1R20_g16358, partial [Candolleomyces eurysporus]